DGGLVPHDLVALELPEAVLRRNRAGELRHRVVDDAIDGGPLRHQPLGADVVMNVAVADMAEGVDPDVGETRRESRPGALDEFGGFRDGHRDVVLYVGE